MRSFVPDDYPISVGCHIEGMCDRDFRKRVIAPGLVELNDRGRVVRASHERHLGYPITPERYLSADRKRDAARRYQRDYYHARQREMIDAVV